MLDGFGWFDEGDFRRAWLLFDEIDYLFPEKLSGPLWYTPNVFEQPEYRAVRLAAADDEEVFAEQVSRDLADADFREAVSKVPRQDLIYARQVVATDGDLANILEKYDPLDFAPAVSLLTSKLLTYAARSGAVPIVGREYAWSILARKLSRPHPVAAKGTLLGTTRQQLSYAAFEAGLSLAFLDSEALVCAPFDRLQRFKSDHQPLLAKHQAHLLSVAHAYRGSPEGAEFAERMAQLRTEAQRERLSLDTELSDAWLSAGLALAKKAVTAGTAAAIPALVVLRSASLHQLAADFLPIGAAALGLAVSGALDVAADVRKASQGHLAYLFRAQKYLQHG